MKFLTEYKRKIDKSAKTRTENKVDIPKDTNTTVMQVLSENKLPYPVENIISSSECNDDIIMTSLFYSFENY